ncbi:MAG: hypothetical protein CMB33_00315 [Euryarchaeota archaeon]|nr:hypothetical protein [Euryarchaeota archaeon]|tara:strand:+ start:399 stop:1226 length:828 start_codon:yes stop_codon:yes gene_type:complete
MNTSELMRATPDELASALLNRRMLLKDSLPGVIRNLEAEEDALSPKLDRMKKAFDEANDKVVKFKANRDECQTLAGTLIPDVKRIRAKLNDSGGMISLDPKWKKMRLLEQIEEIENKIQTSALDHKSERKLLEKRRALISENDKWIRDRKDSNPEMSEYLEKNREMSKLFKKADKEHSLMMGAVTKAQPLYEKMTSASEEIREIRSQLDRAKELLAQSDKAIDYWEKRIENGFGDMGPGFRDLLKGQKNVDMGGSSSFAKRSRKLKDKKSRGEEE